MKPRLLFGSVGWPCGVHEIASQVVRLGLADAVVHRMEPGLEPGLSSDAFLRKLRDFRPHVVGLRVEGGRFESVCREIREIRRIRETTIILGGPTATTHPLELLEQTGADYVFAGDAEESITVFLRKAMKTDSYRYAPEIPGMAYFWAGRGVVNLAPSDPENRWTSESRVPSVDQTTLRENRLDWSLLEGFEQGEPMDSIYLTGGRGCPGRCAFCSRLHGREVRTKTAEQILEEIRGADRLVREDRLRLSRWPLYRSTADSSLAELPVSWCSIFDEDFFLHRDRAVRLLQLFEFHGLGNRYRLGFQTNPRSLLEENGRPDEKLFYWIRRVKPMIQFGAESFHPDRLHRWRKRHTVEQLETVLEAMDRTGSDYNIFQILSDYQSTREEVAESVRRLLDSAQRHPRMRIASTAMMIPLAGTGIHSELGFQGRLRTEHFTDCEQAHPEWMDPAVADLADRLDEALQGALHLQTREESLERVRRLLED